MILLTPSKFENANKPRYLQNFVNTVCVDAWHALLKLFLYGNIVSINSTIMVRRMVCMVKKIKNLIKAYRVLKIHFLSNFCQLTSIFMVFQRKKM